MPSEAQVHWSDRSAAGALDPDAFVIGASAQTADHRVIYNPGSGALSYDADRLGGAAATLIAVLVGKPSIGADDVTVI